MPPQTADPTRDGQHVRITDETTPLLGAAEPGNTTSRKTNDQLEQANGHISSPNTPDGNEPDSPKDDAPTMPYGQLVLLCYTALAEPIAYFTIFPFINEMIHRKGGIEDSSVGFWSGLIESLFSLVQMVLMVFYGRAADRLGRKPVLAFSLTGIAVASALFGMAQNLTQMILFRCLAGCSAGSVVTVRTMIGENCTKETQGRAFSWYMFVRNMGILVGPIIGGGLANPAEEFPSLFGGIAFWEKYPYALATYTTGAITLSAAILTIFFVKETLKRKPDGTSGSGSSMSTREVLQSPGVPIVLYVWAHTMTLALSFTATSTVFLYEPVKLGGTGLSDQKIAILLSIVGLAQSIWILLVFPPLQKNFGTAMVMRWCAIAWPFFMLCYPVMNELLRRHLVTVFWVFAPIVIVVGSGVAMAFTCCQLFINDVSPSPAVLGTVNALALTVNSAVRAYAPIMGTSVFAAGIKSGFADGHAVWILIVGLAVTLNIPLYFLPESVKGQPNKKTDNAASSDGADDEET